MLVFEMSNFSIGNGHTPSILVAQVGLPAVSRRYLLAVGLFQLSCLALLLVMHNRHSQQQNMLLSQRTQVCAFTHWSLIARYLFRPFILALKHVRVKIVNLFSWNAAQTLFRTSSCSVAEPEYFDVQLHPFVSTTG